MAVYEHTYTRYAGPLTAPWSRFLIIPRYYYQYIFKSKIFMTFFVLCFVAPCVQAILIYLRHNATALTALDPEVQDLVRIDAGFFRSFLSIQGVLAFFLNLFVGPGLVSRDTANNGLPLYLCRPFSRTEYVLAKLSVLLILLSSITWAPGLLMFLFQAYLEGGGWFAANAWIGIAILVGGLLWALALGLFSLALSAWIRWRLAAGAALMALYFIPQVFCLIVNKIFGTQWANVINLGAIIRTAWAGLFQMPDRLELPLWAAWAALTVFLGICLFLLSTRIRAYEVVK